MHAWILFYKIIPRICMLGCLKTWSCPKPNHKTNIFLDKLYQKPISGNLEFTRWAAPLIHKGVHLKIKVTDPELRWPAICKFEGCLLFAFCFPAKFTLFWFLTSPNSQTPFVPKKQHISTFQKHKFIHL